MTAALVLTALAVGLLGSLALALVKAWHAVDHMSDPR
jgi:multisubunit Na+/H+ antiporter MnhC subunit